MEDLKPSGRHCSDSWVVLKRFCGGLEAFWGRLGASWTVWRGSGKSFGSLLEGAWGRLGMFWEHLGGVLRVLVDFG